MAWRLSSLIFNWLDMGSWAFGEMLNWDQPYDIRLGFQIAFESFFSALNQSFYKEKVN
jgi:hypothetical protein